MKPTAESPDRVKFSRIYFGLVLIFLVFRLKDQALLSQLQHPALTYLGNDPTYLLVAWSGILRFFAAHYWAALLFDCSLFVSAFISWVKPAQRWSSIAFTVLLGLYLVIGYSYLCFHKHNLVGLWVTSLIFWALSDRGFSLLFELLRFYALYVYASAGFWKFFRGVWDLKGHFGVIIKNDALPNLVQHPYSWASTLASYLIVHPALTDKIMLLVCLIQLSFIFGFFTKRFDPFFLAFALMFHLLSLFLLNAYFIEFSVILITLLPFRFLYHPSETASA